MSSHFPSAAALRPSSRLRPPRLPRLSLAGALFVALLAFNIALNPSRFAPANWGILLGLAAPLLAAAMACTPALLGGRGGIDISIGPLMGFINAVLVVYVMGEWGWTSPGVVLPAAILLGAGCGALNGLLAAVVRMQPIVATLGTYLVLSGLTLTLVPAPTGSIPEWLSMLSGTASILPLAAMGLLWWGLRQLPLYDALMAVGSEERAAYTAGISVTTVRALSYVLGGILAAMAALSLTALIGSADPGIAPSYTLLAISAVALGGVSLAGGQGGLWQAAVGAADIFLLQNALTHFNVSSFVLQMAYGAILVLAVFTTAWRARRQGDQA